MIVNLLLIKKNSKLEDIKGYLSDQFSKYKNTTINHDTEYKKNGLHTILLLLITVALLPLFLPIEKRRILIYLQILFFQ